MFGNINYLYNTVAQKLVARFLVDLLMHHCSVSPHVLLALVRVEVRGEQLRHVRHVRPFLRARHEPLDVPAAVLVQDVGGVEGSGWTFLFKASRL